MPALVLWELPTLTVDDSVHSNPSFSFQIRFQPNDHKTIKETADELKIFEGIKHPNLVRYFGVELHRVSRLQSHCVGSQWVAA